MVLTLFFFLCCKLCQTIFELKQKSLNTGPKTSCGHSYRSANSYCLSALCPVSRARVSSSPSRGSCSSMRLSLHGKSVRAERSLSLTTPCPQGFPALTQVCPGILVKPHSSISVTLPARSGSHEEEEKGSATPLRSVMRVTAPGLVRPSFKMHQEKTNSPTRMG